MENKAINTILDKLLPIGDVCCTDPDWEGNKFAVVEIEFRNNKTLGKDELNIINSVNPQSIDLTTEDDKIYLELTVKLN